MATIALEPDIAGVSPYVLGLRQPLIDGAAKTIARFTFGELAVEVASTSDSLWAFVRREGEGGLALRAAFIPGEFRCTRQRAPSKEAARIAIMSAMGEHVVSFCTGGDAHEHLRMTVRFTPAAPMVMPSLPRDLYPLDTKDDPLGASGNVEAGQRGLNAGLLYFRIDEPGFGNVLYFQNLTAMNDYYRATKTKPDGAVGGEWPELGYLPPTPPQSGTPPIDPLPAGRR